MKNLLLLLNLINTMQDTLDLVII